MIQDYYAFCAYGDSLIGVAVKAFRDYNEQHRQEYLIILAAGDHGWHLGEQGISAKFGPYHMSNHTAVVVVSSDKTKFPAGMVREDYVEFVDFAPTMYAAAGIDLTSGSYDYLDGYDLARVVDRSLPEREYVFGEMNSVYGPRAYIRTPGFAFSMRVREKNNQPSAGYPPNNHIMWALTTSRTNAEMALYDLRVDPRERTNVAYDQAYADLAEWFRIKLGNIALGDGRVEVIWSEENSYDVSDFAPGADDKLIDIPEGIIPDVSF
jgi:arylsulfatase A-like enzyme